MKTTPPSTFFILRNSLALLASLALFTAAPRAPAQTGWGNALSFDGTSDSVLIPRFGTIAPTTEITIEFWQNVSTVTTQATFGLGPDLTSNRMLAHVPWWDGQVHWDFGDISSAGRLAYTPPEPITNSWQHFALVASQSGSFMRIYRNGVLEAQKSGITPFARGDYDLYLGGYSSNLFKGDLDEFRIWNVARTEEQIVAHLHHPLTGAESNLVAYWPFDEEDPGPTTRDASRLGNTGVVLNAPVWQPRTDPPLRLFPQMQATWGAPGEILLSCDAVPGAGFDILTASNLPGLWQPLSGYPPLRATSEIMAHPVVPLPEAHFFRAEIEPMLYAITDLMVSDQGATVPTEYTGLGYNVATLPYMPGVVGVRVNGRDVNTGIGGSTTTIWARYSRLGAWFDAATPVLTDIAVVHWVGWNAVCPDGHVLNDANPICPDGWQRASGTSAGIQGALTTGTDGACWKNGLCVRYQPVGQVLAQNIPYILKLSLSLTTGGIQFPPGEVGWASGGIDIHFSCGDSHFLHVCFKKEFAVPPTRYGITDVKVSDNGAGVPLDYTGLTNRVPTDPYIAGELGVRLTGADVNAGIGGTATSIWAKYGNLATATNLDMPVLKDIAVVHWVDWNAVCPDGHPLPDAAPCVDGWQRASGTSAGMLGALTRGTDGACWKIGLCVRYQTLGEILTNNTPYVERLSLSIRPTSEDSEPVYPSEQAAWAPSPLDIHSACGDNKWVYLCYAKRSFTAPVPPTNEEKLELLTRYAPLVWLAQGERFMPSSVEWAFPYFERFLDTGGYWLRTKQTLSSPSDFSLPVFAGNLDSAPVYAFWVEKLPGARLVDLVYFFYYPYNRGKSYLSTVWGNHVSDWEHATVRLAYGQPEAIYVAAHDFGGACSWYTIAKTNLTHPTIYAALDSHGCWVDPGANSYYSIPFLVDLVDYCSAGTAWSTWGRIEAFDYSAQIGLGTSQWPSWMSTDYSNPGNGDPSIPGNGPILRWGNPQQGACVGGECQLNDGPTGPAAKGVWNPATFQ